MAKNLTTTEFIEKVVQKYGLRYDYSKTEYISAQSKVTVICKIHGDFEQTPNSHMNGRGCKKCGIDKITQDRRKSLDDFIAKANVAHGFKYDYSKVSYKNTHTKITVVCPIHGDFHVEPKSHLSGCACSKCASSERAAKSRLSREDFISRAKAIHGTKYEYGKVEYTTNSDKVIITCREHGDFSQDAAAHMQGKGCKSCANEVISQFHRKDTEYFLNAARNVHGDTYDYSKVEYIVAKQVVEIICEVHGSFWQSPDKHASGQGCPKCASYGFDKENSGVLYVMECGDITKVGITNRDPQIRAREVGDSYGSPFTVSAYFRFAVGDDAYQLEKELLKILRSEADKVSDMFDGSTECFLNVDRQDLINKITQKVGNASH